MNPLFLTLEEVLLIHRNQIELYGGSNGIRDMGLLESAVAGGKAEKLEIAQFICRNTSAIAE